MECLWSGAERRFELGYDLGGLRERFLRERYAELTEEKEMAIEEGEQVQLLKVEGRKRSDRLYQGQR
jgi:hypothetical protein